MGVISDHMEKVEPALLQYGEFLGGDIDSLDDLPFSEEADKDGMPEPLYVRHDKAVVHDTAVSLLNGHHLGLISPYGTGKTALREIFLRDIGEDKEGFITTFLENPGDTTSRQLYVTVLKKALDQGYKIDTSRYEQIRNGVPWKTDEAKKALRRIVNKAEDNNEKLILIIDEIEDFPKDLMPALQTIGDIGVRLFIMGTPEGKERLKKIRDTLDSRIKWYDNRISPFSQDDINEYIGRSMAYFRGEEYNDDYPIDPFTDETIEKIYEKTNGNPRDVRLECADALAKGAIAWLKSGKKEDFRIDSEILRKKITVKK